MYTRSHTFKKLIYLMVFNFENQRKCIEAFLLSKISKTFFNEKQILLCHCDSKPEQSFNF